MTETELRNFGYLIRYNVTGYDVYHNSELIKSATINPKEFDNSIELIEKYKSLALSYAEAHFHLHQVEAG
jgi:hypothetical protein